MKRILLALLMLSGYAYSLPAYVSSGLALAGTNLSGVQSIACATGNTLAITVTSTLSGSETLGLSNTAGNTQYTIIGNQHVTPSVTQSLFLIPTCNGTTGNYIWTATSTKYTELSWIVVADAGTIDIRNSCAGTGYATPGCAVTTTITNDVTWGVTSGEGGTTFGPAPSGFTALNTGGDVAAFYRAGTLLGSVTFGSVATTQNDNSNLALVVSFKNGTYVAPTLTSIAVIPANATIVAGATQQYTATGTYRDSSTANITPVWSSSIGAINSSGVLSNTGNGAGTITAKLSGLTGTTRVTVTPYTPILWYIRTDGGTATQCTGHTNAAYPGSGTGQPCAMNHPYWLLNQSTFVWLIAGGDIVQFGDLGPYYMGQGPLNGLGISWPHCVGGAPDCILPPLPSGTAANPTKFLGKNAGSCHNGAQTATVEATRLVGINAAYWIIPVIGSAYPDVECFDLSQPDQCTLAGISKVPVSYNCSNGSSNYATHGLMLSNAPGGGVFNPGPSNGTFKDISIHGLANEAITGSKINATSGDTTSFKDIFMYGNGMAGFDSDAGGCGGNCESVGTINMSHFIVNWNGCMEVKPNGGTIGGNGYTYCVDQPNGGYGDGFTMIATGGTWNISDITANWNVQDGFDGLHMGDDATVNPYVNLLRLHTEGNVGNQLKTGGIATVYNSVAIGNCKRLQRPYAPNPAGYSTYTTDFCRPAGGSTTTFQLLDNRSITVAYNTFVNGDESIQQLFTCVQNASCIGTSGIKPVVVFQNNIDTGVGPGANTPGMYYDTDAFNIGNPFSNPGSVIKNNLWYQQSASSGGGSCPQDTTYETNATCTNPLLAGQASEDAIDPTLTAASKAIGRGAAYGSITQDYQLFLRPNPPAIGAFEYAPLLLSGTFLQGVFSGVSR